MKRSEYEQRRRALEETFEAEIATVRAAQEIRRRAFEAIWRADLEDDEPPEAPAVPPAPPPPPVDLTTALEEILPRLPDAFDKHDVVRLLGWSPPRASLFRFLQNLVLGGRLTVERYGAGRTSTIYRKPSGGAP